MLKMSMKGWEKMLIESERMDEQDKALALRLMRRAIEVLESEENAKVWLFHKHVKALGCRIPFEYARNGPQYEQEVFDLLGRLDWGVYT